MQILLALSPIFIVALGTLLLMLAEAFQKHQNGLSLGAAITCFSGVFASLGLWSFGLENIPEVASFAPWLIVDKFALFFFALLCLAGGITSLFAGAYLAEHRMERGEFYHLIMLSTLGAMVLAAAGDVLTLFLGLETMSLGVYAMVAFRRGSPRSAEAALKYFLLGSFAAAILLFGFGLLYGATGHTDLSGMGKVLASGGVRHVLVIFGLLMVLAGLAFKVSAVPFHMWTPDAYEGAPSPATSFMAASVKAAAFAVMLRVLLVVFSDAGSSSWAAGWPPVLAWISVLTMTVGNLIATRQESVKRMLAYSSIAHAGYALVGVVASSQHGFSDASASVLFYMLTYSVSTLGAFGALIWAGKYGAEVVSYEDLSGIGKRHPALGLAFSFFLLSLAGLPPTAGFFGKWYLLKSAIEGGFTWLSVVAFLNSVIAAYYYLKVLVFMYMKEPVVGAQVATPMRSASLRYTLLLCAVFVALLGMRPGSVLIMAFDAAHSLIGG